MSLWPRDLPITLKLAPVVACQLPSVRRRSWSRRSGNGACSMSSLSDVASLRYRARLAASSGLPPFCRTPLMVRNWQLEVIDGNQDEAALH